MHLLDNDNIYSGTCKLMSVAVLLVHVFESSRLYVRVCVL